MIMSAIRPFPSRHRGVRGCPDAEVEGGDGKERPRHRDEHRQSGLLPRPHMGWEAGGG